MPREETIVIQPSTRGSSANLVQNETTFPTSSDFNSASLRFQFFVSNFTFLSFLILLYFINL